MLRRLVPLLMLSVLLVAPVACAAPANEEPVDEAAGNGNAPVENVEDVGEEAENEAASAEDVEEEAAAGVPAACAEDPDGRACAVIAPGDSIRIGFAGPMTGDYSAFGTDISQAGLMAIRDVGEHEGFDFELLVEDTQGSGEGGAAVANLFVSDPNVVAIAGHTFSGSTAAAIPIYNEARLPMLSGSATRADLTEGDQDVFNRIAFTDDVQGSNVAEYLKDSLGVQKIAVMHDGDAYGQGLAEKVKDVFTELGGEVVAFEPITPGEADYSGPLNAIGAAGPEALFYGGYDAEAAVIKNQMGVAGMADVVFFSDDGAFGVKFLDLTGDNAEGAYATSAVPPASGEKDAFETGYMDKYGFEAGSLSTFTWHGYDIVSALIDVIKETAVVGDDGSLYIPREALVANTNSLTGFAGLTGDITCNGEGECNTAGPTFFVVEGGEWVQAP